MTSGDDIYDINNFINYIHFTSHIIIYFAEGLVHILLFILVFNTKIHKNLKQNIMLILLSGVEA